jgi:hypothetical protein
VTIAYFTKMYQAVPALVQLQKALGGQLVTTRPSTVRAIRRVYPEAAVTWHMKSLGRFSPAARCLDEARLIVTGTPYRRFLSPYPAEKCTVFHGTYAFMGEEEVEALRHIGLICVIGPRMQEVLEDAGLGPRLIPSGYLPFLDFPPRNPGHRADFLRKLRLDPENRTVLYLPRGKPYGSWNVMAEKLLREIPRHVNLILRPHPSQSVTARIRERFHFLKISRLCRQRGNAVLDLAGLKPATLFSAADLLISDGASSPEESLYYDLPQVFIESEGSSPAAIAAMMRRKNIADERIQKHLAIYRCGNSITPDSPGILKTVLTTLEESERHRPQREAFFHWVFGDRTLERQNRLIHHLKQYAP